MRALIVALLVVPLLLVPVPPVSVTVPPTEGLPWPAAAAQQEAGGAEDAEPEALLWGPARLAPMLTRWMVPAGARAEAGGSASVPAAGAWQWPLPGTPEVVRAFDPPEHPWLPGHRGIDLAGLSYAPVLAVADGVVTHSGSIAGVGTVSITHPSGIRSTYQPLIERVPEGTRLTAGEQIGQLGVLGSHCLLRSCLHLGAVRGSDYLDPLLLLQSWQLTLLPHEGR